MTVISNKTPVRDLRRFYGILGILAITLVIGELVVFPRLRNPSNSVYFDDSAADLMRLGNQAYEVGIDKQNGGIVYILDKTTQQQISAGNLEGCLWEVNYSISRLNSCHFTPDGANRFEYSWSASNKQLLFTYSSDPSAAKRVNVIARITASEGKWFDLQIEIQNDWGLAAVEIKFPSSFVFSKNEINGALLPVIPGVVLEPGFFDRNINYGVNYPGYPGVFADFMALSSSQGTFTMYSTGDGQRLEPVYLGFDFSNCTGVDRVCFTHNFKARVPNGSAWTSPRVRIRISETWDEAINGFREDAGIAAAASLLEKLGERYATIAQAPLYKADASQLRLRFSDYPALLEQIPYPGILHLVGYGARGFDRNYPDFLPPDAQWGSTQDMAAMFDAARSLGYVVMPYINPTWWDGESPTLKQLPPPLTIRDVASRSDQDMPVEECYGCPGNPHYGYVMSPYAAFVQERLARLIRQMHSEVQYDLLFEDQIGARANIFDYNPASPSPEAYIQGWVEHTRVYSDSLLMTESGFDRLFETEIGFHGSVLLAEKKGETTAWWGGGNWHYYPFVTLLGRDKAFFYQHNLAPETFTHQPATFAWNVAMGYMLSYDLFQSELGGGVNDDWIKVVSAFQKFVLSQYASERMLSYTVLEGNVTQSAFESVTVAVNWDGSNPVTLEDTILPPLGLLIQKKDSNLRAGVFNSYNNAPLSDGNHYLIEERSQNEIILRQPLGADTNITIRLLANWQSTTPLEVWAFTKEANHLSKVPAVISSGGITFTYQQMLSGQQVAFYRISKP